MIPDGLLLRGVRPGVNQAQRRCLKNHLRWIFQRCFNRTFITRAVDTLPVGCGWNGYGSIPIDTFLVGWTSIYQLFWGSLGTRVLTHPQMSFLSENFPWESSYVARVKSVARYVHPAVMQAAEAGCVACYTEIPTDDVALQVRGGSYS